MPARASAAELATAEMPAGAGEEGGTAAGRLVQLLPRRVAADVEAAVVVAARQQPAIAHRRGVVIAAARNASCNTARVGTVPGRASMRLRPRP